MKASEVATLRDSVEAFLRKSYGPVRIDSFGYFWVTHRGVTTAIAADAFPDEHAFGRTAVFISSVLNLETPVSPEITRFLATEAENLVFGQFELHEDTPRVLVTHALLGDSLTEQALTAAVDEVAGAVTRYGPLVKQRYGGKFESEDSESCPEARHLPAGSLELESLRKKVGSYLRDNVPGVSVDEEGDYTFRYEYIVIRIRPAAWTEGRTLVKVWSLTNLGVRVDAELTKFLVTRHVLSLFGGFRLDERTPAVIVGYTLLGDDLSEAELMNAISGVMGTAHKHAREIERRFGGNLLFEP